MSKSLSSPVDIDTEIARLSGKHQEQAIIIERQISYRDSDSAYTRHFFEQDTLDAAEAKLAEIEAELGEVEALYTGWPRYWHVTNVGGHIHTSTHCSSCFPTTQYGWRTDLSGKTEQEVVDLEAYNACTVCMPIAPAEQKAAREYFNRQQREAKAAERQAKADEKAAKAAARASKLVDKVEAAIKALTGEGETFEAIQVFRNEWSDYGHEGLKAVYGISWQDEYKALKINSTTEDVLSFIVAKDKWNKPNVAVQAELRERGLIA